MANKAIEEAIIGIEEDLPRNLRQLRKDRHFSQKDLADRSEVDIRNISAIERGHRKHVSTKTLAKLAYGLGCRAGDLVRAKQDARSQNKIEPLLDDCILALRTIKAQLQ